MGFSDRDYYRNDASARRTYSQPVTATGILIAANVAVWLVQIVGGPGVSDFLSATVQDLARWQIYKPLTACFAHSTDGVFHLLWNMLFLHFLGRELETIYGRREFLVFYLIAGAVSILAELAYLWLSGSTAVRVLGASGAIMGIVVLFACFYPNRRIYFLFFLPLPVWALCALYVVSDLMGAIQGPGDGVAHLAHLAGGFVGLSYWIAHRRGRRRKVRPQGIFGEWLSVLRGAISRVGRRASSGSTDKVIPFPSEALRRSSSLDREGQGGGRSEETTEISQRIDDILEKISAQGKESLTEAEWTFLRENSSRYRT